MVVQTFKKILVPIDDSEHSLHAFRYALGLAQTQGAHVALLHCYPRIPMLVGGEIRAKLVKEYVQATEKLLAPHARKMREVGVEPALVIVEGQPGEAIIEEAKNGYDLVVMGFRGRSELEGILMGSTAHSVLSGSRCPVLLTR